MRRFRIDPSNIEDDSNPLDIYLTTLNPDAQIIQELIIYHYGNDLLRIINSVFDDDWRQQPDSEQIKHIFEAILNEASTNVDLFTRFGESKVWLFNLASKITLKRYRTAQWRKHFQLRISHQPNIQRSPPIESYLQPYCQFLDQLKPFERLSILLFQYFGLSTEQVEKILELSPRKLNGFYSLGYPSQNINTTEIKRLNETLNSVLKSRYNPAKCFNDYIFLHQDKPRTPFASKYQFNQKLWKYIKDSFVLIALFVCTIVLISYLRAIEPPADPKQISSNLSTPTPINEAPSYIATISPSGLVDLIGSVTTPLLYTSEPSLSHDGRYLVFSTSLDFLLPGETNNTADIYIFDRQTGSFERLSDPNNDSIASISHYSPGISADGRWITFASQEPYLIRGVIDVCSDTNQRVKCPTIFLHDRLTGSTIPIIRENQNSSFVPTISSNGRWIVYWSEARNLLYEENLSCGNEQLNQSCFDIYVFDNINQQTERIQIGRDPSKSYLEPVSISDDGNLLALTLTASDLIVKHLRFVHPTNSVLYNRQTKEFIHINRTNSGEYGNQSSSNSTINTRGDRAIFVSRADNLIDHDNNNMADLFYFDLSSGSSHLVSQNASGDIGNAESGTSNLPGVTGWGEPLSLSADGRYIAYISHADNLTEPLTERCGHPGKTICSSIYVYDSVTGNNELILAGRGRDSYYLYSIISGDGRWLAIVEQYLSCSPTDLCTELWLYDRETKYLYNPIRAYIAENQSNAYHWPDVSLSHGSSVTTLAVSPDGSLLASGANDGTIQLYQTSDWSLLNTLDAHNLPVSDLVITADGKNLISASKNGAVYSWSLPQGTLDSKLVHTTDPILSLALSLDGKHLAAVGQSSIWIWDITNGDFFLSGSHRYQGAVLYDVSYSPDSTLLAIAANDGNVWLYRPTENNIIMRLGGHVGKVLTIDFSPDGSWLASGGSDNSIRTWKISQQGDGIITASAHTRIALNNWITNLIFLPGTSTFASAALDNAVHLWNLLERREVSPGLHIRSDEIISLTALPDGHTVIAGTIGGNIHIWETKNFFSSSLR